MTNCTKRVAKDVLGESKECGWSTKETWWWNKEVQWSITLKRERERERESIPKVELLPLMKIIKWRRRKQKKEVQEAKCKA